MSILTIIPELTDLLPSMPHQRSQINSPYFHKARRFAFDVWVPRHH